MDKTFIIAEAGVNHNGDISLAEKLIVAAKEAGADAVKFQTFKADALVTKQALKAEYQASSAGNTQYELLKSLELSYADFSRLDAFAKGLGIQFLSSPFDLESVEFLNEIGMALYKIPSGEMTNFPLLKAISATGKKVLMSTGMCMIEDI
ncbi:MAG: N,N'-diacetyllegionaminate synthase, partial [Candidatus Marinamargulisbacteria bacterium]